MIPFKINSLQLGGLLLVSGLAAATCENRSSICATIDAALPGRIGYPGGSLYNSSQTDYYVVEERDLNPNCIFRPRDTADVSQAMKLINPHGDSASASKFAVRSGGHMLFSGAANINDGVTIDMRGIDSVVLSEDRTVASVGGGAVFSNVYPQLVPYNLTVLGGRISGIAIGGFTPGGGINFLSRKYGWSCDNVYGYEVVLANGDVVYATASQHADLWLALKGGSFNYGIVTRFDMATFPLGDMWGGFMFYNYTQSNLDATAQALTQFMGAKDFDALADLTAMLVFESADAGNPQGTFALANGLFYSAPVAYPEVFQPFTSIPSISPNTLAIGNISAIVEGFDAISSSTASRVLELVYSFKNADAATYSQLISTWQDSATTLANITGLELILLFQPMPVTNGTNSLGLPANEAEMVIGAVEAAYSDAADDALVRATLNKILDEHLAILRAKGLALPFQYLNYADVSQDPFTSYGAANKAQLKRVAKTYDPAAIFQVAAPGGMKLSNSK